MEILFGQCRVCGYSLKGLTERRCPECGTTFDPDDPRTMVVFEPPMLVRFVSRKISVWTFFPVFLAGGAYVLAGFVLRNALMRDVLAVPLALIGVGTLYMVWARIRFQMWERRRRRKRGAFNSGVQR
jgi:hypothetical protein